MVELYEVCSHSSKMFTQKIFIKIELGVASFHWKIWSADMQILNWYTYLNARLLPYQIKSDPEIAIRLDDIMEAKFCWPKYQIWSQSPNWKSLSVFAYKYLF